MRRHPIIIPLCIMLTCHARAQVEKNTTHLQQLWLGYYSNVQLNSQWSAGADFQLRTATHFTEGFSLLAIRPGISWSANKHIKLTVGYAYFHYYPADNHKKNAQPEHRPWQQIQWTTSYQQLTVVQTLRLEERYRKTILNDSTLSGSYNFNYRIRYGLSFQLPLAVYKINNNSLALIASDEVHINFGKEIVNNYFDQNRFFAGIKCPVSSSDYIITGYMNSFQQLSQGHQYRALHVIRLSYFQQIELKNKSYKKF